MNPYLKYNIFLFCTIILIKQVDGQANSPTCFKKEVENAISWINKSDESKEKEALKILTQTTELELSLCDSCMALLWYKRGVAEFRMNDLGKTIDAYKRALAYQLAFKPKHHELSIRLINNIGTNYFRTNQELFLDSAYRYLTKAITLNEKRISMGKAHTSTYPSTLVMLGRYYTKKGDWDNATKYLESSSQVENKKRMLGVIYNDLLILYSKYLSDPETGIRYGQKGLKSYRSTLETWEGDTADLFLNMGVAYANLGLIKRRRGIEGNYFDKAFSYYRKALHLYPKSKEVMVLNNLGVLLTYQGKHQQALDTLLLVSDLNRKKENIEELAMNLDGIGDANRALGNIQAALEAYSESLQYQFAGFEPMDIFDLPIIQKHASINARNALTTLKSKAQYFQNLYQSGEKDETYLLAAINTFACIDDLIEQIRLGVSAEASKFSLSAKAKPIYESAIQACLLMTEISDTEIFKEQAFYYSEKSKALSLLESMQAMQAAHAGISEQEKDSLFKLIQKKDLVERELALAQLKGEGEEVISKYLAEVPIHRNRLENYMKWLEANRESYFNIKFGLKIATVADVRSKLLNEDQGMLAYFLGDKSRYAFIIEKDEMRIESLDNTLPLFDWTQELHYSIKTYYSDDSDKKAKVSISELRKKYCETSYALYHSLVKPLGDLPERLIIIPDEYLLYLPFELFLTHHVEEVNNFYTYPYLIKEKIISYGFSATLLKEISDRKHRKNSNSLWTGLAPGFLKGIYDEAGRPVELPPLAQSLREIDSLSHRLQGQAHKEEDANYENLLKAFTSSEVVHISTHAFVNDEGLNLVYFSLWDTTLYATDIATCNINSELIVLNACETNVGQLHKGEGMASLNRAFISAGTESIITTFWQVKDGANWEFLLNFYKEVFKGSPIDVALAQAKRQALTKQDPFFWGTNVLYGKTSPIKTPINWLLICLIMLGGLSLYFILKKLRTIAI